MANVFDVATYILERNEKPMSALKLQKLVYYCQAWSLVWDEKPIFNEQVEAWSNGPVVRDLYQEHRGKYEVSLRDINGDSNVLTTDEKDTVDVVMRDYGNKPAPWLVMLSHSELPWRQAREGLEPFEQSSRVIELDDIANYYSGLLPRIRGSSEWIMSAIELP